jgi:hypothetical protein
MTVHFTASTREEWEKANSKLEAQMKGKSLLQVLEKNKSHF